MITRRIPQGRFVIVADSGVARILRASGNWPTPSGKMHGESRLEEIARLDSPAARQFKRELVSDRTGRVFDSRGRGGVGPPTRSRHGAASDYDPRKVETERFAKRLSRRLDIERRRLRMYELVLIAAPRFLGVLRPELSGPTRELVSREVTRDLTHATDERILRAAFR